MMRFWAQRRVLSSNSPQEAAVEPPEDQKGKPAGRRFSFALVTVQVLQVALLLSIGLVLPKIFSLSSFPWELTGSTALQPQPGKEAQLAPDICMLYKDTCQPKCNCSETQSTPVTLCPQTSVPHKGYTPPVFAWCNLQILGGRPRDGYGSWPLCSNQIPSNSTIYSFGIGGDVSFDTTMIARGHRVYGFDPTVKPEEAQALFRPNHTHLLKGFSFMQVGLGSSNGVVWFMRQKRAWAGSMTALKGDELKGNLFREEGGFLAPVLTLSTLMAALKHDHIDLLKVDVEGVEFDICDTDDFLEALERVGHLIFEFHERFLKRFWGRKPRCINRLKSKGFSLVKWTMTGEYVFARMKILPPRVVGKKAK